MDVFVSILKDYGLPAVCLFALAWYIKYRDDKSSAEFREQRETHTQEMKEQRQSHEREVTKLRETLEGNTRVLQELLFYLKGGEK